MPPFGFSRDLVVPEGFSAMDEIAFYLIMIGVFIIYIAAVSWGHRKKKEKKKYSDPLAFVANAGPFSPESLAPGAIISRGGVDYVVRGTLTCKQGPYVWHEHLIDGGGKPGWFEVEVDEGQLNLVLWHTERSAQLRPMGTITYMGMEFRETERGPASFTSIGTTGLPASGEMTYVDYAGPNGRLLTLEQFGPDAPWEVSLGEIIQPGEVVIYPAPPETGSS
ncbi:MAG: DUF4178 domain-containing protein [Corynebacterium sp.]|uniref:DUF4178 domain-containing protein n=1 Tax=Corynebacterium sp. TaxID=1720 RepID=UPI0026DB0A37|nr:DUF4178 domain-containing protein [Corynebacterium sp.]MDO5097657.1 DUF4178 domain-containing protein [Corynebacterium sp.]